MSDTNTGTEITIPPDAVASNTEISVPPSATLGSQPGNPSLRFGPPTSVIPQLVGSLFANTQEREEPDEEALTPALRDLSITVSILQLVAQIENTTVRQALKRAVATSLTRQAQALDKA